MYIMYEKTHAFDVCYRLHSQQCKGENYYEKKSIIVDIKKTKIQNRLK